MLSFFRRGGAASILGGAVVFAIILVFALEFRPGRQGAGAGLTEECAVEVYDRCVTEKEYLAEYRLMAPPGAEAKALRRIGLSSHVLNGLVERELLLREAERLQIAISENEIDEELTRGRAHVSLPVAHARNLGWQLGLCPRPESPLMRECEPGADLGVRLLPVTNTKTGKFDYAKYERVIRTTTNRGAREFKEMMRRELIAERMRRLVQSRVRVSEPEAFEAYEREFSKAVVRIVQLKRDWFARYVADVSDSAVDAWAAENAEQVNQAWEADRSQFVAGCPLASEIRLDVAEKASDDEVAQLRAKLEALATRAANGEDFAQLARESSEARSAVIGGRLGCLTEEYGEGGAELVAALNDVKDGGLSQVVRTKHGLHLLKLHGRLAEADVEFEGRRHTARTLAVRFEAHELAKQFAEELIGRAKGGETLEAATNELARAYAERGASRAKGSAAKRNPKPRGEDTSTPDADLPALSASDRPVVQESPPFSIGSNPIPGAAPGEAPAREAFALTEPDAVHPVPIATLAGWAVMQLKEKHLATREEFDHHKAELVASLRAAKAADALVRYVKRLRTAAESHIHIAVELLKEEKDDSSSDDD